MLTGTGDGGPGPADGADELRQRARDFLLGHDPATLPRLDFLRARFDDGLAAGLKFIEERLAKAK